MNLRRRKSKPQQAADVLASYLKLKAVAKTARSAVRAYGAVRHTQGRLSGRRSRGAHPPKPLLLVAAAGGGAAVGFLAHPQTLRAAGQRTRALIRHDQDDATNDVSEMPIGAIEVPEVHPLTGGTS